MNRDHWLLRAKPDFYWTGDSWGHRLLAKRFARKEHAVSQIGKIGGPPGWTPMVIRVSVKSKSPQPG